MSEKTEASIKATPEQVLYAYLLEKGMYIGLAGLFITFALYVFQILAPYIPLDEISRYWSLSSSDYLHEAHIKTGWSWVAMVAHGDFLNFIPIAILAGVTIVCYIAIVPLLFKNNDLVYAILAILEVLVLSLAASGILTAGH